MKSVQKTVLLWYSPQEMYALVSDVNRYGEFLPWVERAGVLEQHEDGVSAEVAIAFGGVRQTFSTRNVHVAPSQIRMCLLKGPFSRLEGEWNFRTLGDGQQRACKVELHLRYGLARSPLGKLAAPALDKVAAALVDAFVQRARQVYGD